MAIWSPSRSLHYMRFKARFFNTKRFCFPRSHLHLINMVFVKSIAMVIEVPGLKKKFFKMPAQYVTYLQVFDNVAILSSQPFYHP